MRVSTSYERTTPTARWRESEVKVDYLGYEWMRKMTGKEEVRFFNSLHWARAGQIRYSDEYYFTSISPSRCEKVYDRFIPIRIPWSEIGYREREALTWACWHMRCTESKMVHDHEWLVIHYQTDEHEERTVTYDVTIGKFVA